MPKPESPNIQIRQNYRDHDNDLRIDPHGNGFRNIRFMMALQLDQLLGEANAQANRTGADIVESRLPLMTMAVAVTDQAIVHFLGHPDDYAMSKIADLERDILGGVGTLTTTDVTGGALAVTDQFGPNRLKTPAFASELHERVNALFEAVAHTPEKPYNETAEEHRLLYLRQLFFGTTITDENMLVVSDYVTSTFASLLKLFPRNMFRERMPFAKHFMPFLPKELAQKKEQADTILDAVVREKLAVPEGERPEVDLFDFLIKHTEFLQEMDFDTRVGQLRSDALQVLFAAKETTPSGVGAVLRKLALDPAEQKRLRTLINDYFEKKGTDVLTYDDLLSHDPAMIAFHILAGQTLVEDPPTPLTARTSRHDVTLANGEEIKANTDVYLSLADGAKGLLARGWELNDVDDVLGLPVFGDGRKKCKGGRFAIMEMIATTAHWLHHTKSFELTEAGQKVTTSTASFQGMRFEIERKVKE